MTNTTKTTHKNGLRIISHYIPDVPAVSFNIFVKAGSRLETSENSGVAHFFEHMVFKGTPKRPSPNQIAYDLESIGADVNAATGQEYTVYYLKVLKENLEKGVEILSDAFLHSLLDPAEVEKEREVIKEEIKMYEDDPSSYADDELLENLYPKDQYGRNIAGTLDGLNKLGAEEIKSFVDNHYFSNNTVIIAVGDIHHEDLENLVDKYFEEMRVGQVEERDFVAEKFIVAEKSYKKDIQQAQLRLATYSVPFSNLKKYKIGVAADILGAGQGSKLFLEIREKLGLAYSIYAFNKHWSKSGYLVIGAGLSADKINSVRDITMQEIKKLADGNFTQQDLSRAKEMSKSAVLMSMDTVDSWAWFIGKRECLYNELATIDELITGIDDVSAQDVQEIMHEFSQQEWHSTIVTG